MNSTTASTTDLSPEQAHVLEIVSRGRNLFLTGGGGVGKSFVIHQVVAAQKARGRVVAVAASTGVAAEHIGGVTLHSLLGLGLAADPLPQLIAAARRNKKVSRTWKRMDLLVVDEVSMIEPLFFEKVDRVVRVLRENTHLPFGGLQLVLAGDFFQLPPVNARRDGGDGGDAIFCFQTDSWKHAVDAVVELTSSFRQAGDRSFEELLRRARVGACTTADFALLSTRLVVSTAATTLPRQRRQQRPRTSDDDDSFDFDVYFGNKSRSESNTVSAVATAVVADAGAGSTSTSGGVLVEPTRMHARRMNVDSINEMKLAELSSSTEEVFYAHVACSVQRGGGRDGVNTEKRERLKKVADRLNTHAPVKMEMQLRVGAQVMLLWNLDTENGLVNGSRGVIVRWSRDSSGVKPVVRFKRRPDVDVVIEPHTWEYKVEDAGLVTLTQVPLQLAWAITVHKAQGLSMDCVEMALDESVFEHGQAYVALSRVTSLAGLHLLSFNPGVIVAHPLVTEFYRGISANATARKRARSSTSPTVV
jgi:ATP-dependent DNA helicase PIF1